jgi:DNA-binding transcriptional MerR regulator
VAARSTAKPSRVLTIKGAAEIIGVSEMTLRRWDDSGKFRARRHPVNGYRLYDRARVLSLRKRIMGSGRGAAA